MLLANKFKILICTVLFSFISIANAEVSDKYRVALSELVVSNAVSAKNTQIILDSSLIKEIENAIRNSRKFEVLTRDSNVMAKIRTEQEFAQGDLANDDGAAREGGFKTAQSLIIVEVNDFKLGHSAKKMPRVDKYEVSDSASLFLTVQLIDTTTGSVNTSFIVKATSSTGTKISNSAGGTNMGLLPGLITKASEQVAVKLFDAIFPMTVIAVKDKQVYINRGQDSGISIGQVFEIFEKGESLIDPDTGEDLGTTETKLGSAKVISIKPKVSILELKSGNFENVKKGNLVRKSQ